MATRTPLILNQTTARIEELAAADTIPGTMIEGFLGRNFLINGDFRFWQRGTSFSTNSYGADRFLNNTSGAPCTMSRIALGAGELGGFTTACRMSFGAGSAAADYATLQPRLENLAQFSGRTLTFSGYMRATTVGLKVAFEGSMIAGPGGSFPSGMQTNALGVTTFTPSTTWERFTATFTLPNLTGVVFGPYSALSFNLWLSAGSNHNFRNNSLGFQSGVVDFVGLQLEHGSTATDFEQRPDALELMLCQRYYEKSYNTDIPPGTANTTKGVTQFQIGGLSNSGRTISLMVPFRVAKRAEPAFTTYSYVTGAAGRVRDAVAATDVTPGNSNMGTSGGSLDVTLAANATVNVVAHWTADAEL